MPPNRPYFGSGGCGCLTLFERLIPRGGAIWWLAGAVAIWCGPATLCDVDSSGKRAATDLNCSSSNGVTSLKKTTTH